MALLLHSIYPFIKAFEDNKVAMQADTTIGHYRIIRQLGKGGMGEVYLAEDTNLKREVAIKVLPERLRNNQDRLHRFRREAEAAAKLKHNNIATIYALENFDDELLIVMEYQFLSLNPSTLPFHGPLSSVERNYHIDKFPSIPCIVL